MEKTLKSLLPLGQQVVSVLATDHLEHALTLMREHDFHQMPVLTADGKCLGLAITMRSVLDTQNLFGADLKKLLVKQAIVQIETFRLEEDLLEALDDIQQVGFAVLVDGSDKAVGIVTTADTTEYLRRHAADIMLVAFAERSLKSAIGTLYEGDEAGRQDAIAKACDRSGDARQKFVGATLKFLQGKGIAIDPRELKEAFEKVRLGDGAKKFEMLSFEEFSQMLLSHPRRPKLDGCDDETEVRTMLRQVREIRNKLAHFRGELTEIERRALKQAERWLEEYAASLAFEPVSPGPSQSQRPAGVPDQVRPPVQENEADAGMYTPLGSHLAGMPMPEGTVRMSFEEISNILRKQLPKSAYEYRAWWANDPDRPQAAEWLNAGWRAQYVNMGERRVNFVRIREREDAYIRFFDKVKKRLLRHSEFPLAELGPQGQSWHIFASLPWKARGSATINGSFARLKKVRTEIYIDCGDAASNKQLFDRLFAESASFEQAFGEALAWERMPEKTASRVAVYTAGHITSDEKALEGAAEWMTDRVLKFHRVFLPFFERGQPNA